MSDNKPSEAKQTERIRPVLLQWYLNHKRPLPWRENRDPYRIWISEIMLQQTTSTAVKGFFERFMTRFPKLTDLAKASLGEVYEVWAGLGYYSRARNILKTAQLLKSKKFPETYLELIELPGIGPYTARAISSQAFGERVGVVDGNVSRVFCRFHDFRQAWWTTTQQKEIQKWSDSLVQKENPSDLNQALMELGATVCTPKSPACLICPISPWCSSFKNQSQDLTPIPKPRKTSEIWIWNAEIYQNNKGELLLVKNNDTPFLKNKWVFPGQAQKVKTAPKEFDYRHGITHHDIYVRLNRVKNKPKQLDVETQFSSTKNISKVTPFALIQKAVLHLDQTL